MADEKKYSAKDAALAVLKKTEELLKSHSLMKAKVMSDMSGGQKRGPEGYGKYQEQAQNQKGVHTPVSGVTNFPGGKGSSEAGNMSTETYGGKPHKELREHGKELHRKKLAEMKAMPKPNLGKAEDVGQPDGVQAQAQTANPDKVNANPAPGASPQNVAPYSAEMKGHLKLAKFIGRMDHKKKSSAAPIDKAETGHEKGVHTKNHEGEGNSPAGSFSSAAVKGNTSLPKATLNEAAKDEHKKVLGEMKAMPKPKLPR